MARMLAALWVIAAAGCGDAAQEGPLQQFSYELVTDAAPAEALELEPVPGGLHVRGRLSAPTPCQTLAAATDRTGRTIELTITVRAQDVMCAQMIAEFAYSASLVELPAGAWQLRVRHTWPDTGWPDEVIERPLELS
jgi:hypothetical protein